MAARTTARICDECGMEGSHLLIWMDSASDALSSRVPLHHLPFYDALVRVIDRFIDLIGRTFFFFGSMLRLVSASEDTDTAVSDRSRFLWLEAKRRGLRELS